MSDTVIKVENLSKQYRIGSAQAGYRTFRETLTNAVKAPLQQIERLFNRQSSIVDRQSETIWALKDVSFEVKRGEVVGIIGRNGAGKSTLLKILSKITEPTKGRVELRGRVGSLLEVGTGFHPELTGHENVYMYGAILGMDRWEVTRKFDEIVAFAEIEKFIETPVKRYSSGMYMRLAFAVAAHMETEILLVDEVLAVGDAAFQKKCLGKMGDVATEGRTVLFVSHNLSAVNSLCERAILLDHGLLEKSGKSGDIITYYREKIFADIATGFIEPGLWGIQDDPKGDGATIVAVELLNPNTGYRQESVITNNSVAFRLHYDSKIGLKEASFQFGICTEDDRVLLNYYTQPSDGIETPITNGKSYIDCIFQQFPLAAGDYYIMVGIAHTMVKWIYRNKRFAKLTVLPHYRQGSQRALTSDEGYFYIEHDWKMKED